MSNETTTTSLAALTHASLVQPVLIKALSEKSGLYRYARQFDLRSQATAAAKIPTQTAWWGTPADHGAAIDHTRHVGRVVQDLARVRGDLVDDVLGCPLDCPHRVPA